MKSFVLFLVLVTSAARAAEIWDPPSEGEIARQFSKHPATHIYSSYPPKDIRGGRAYHGIEQIGIERTGCYGTCPSYSLVINRDGTFHYHGDRFTKRRGGWHGTVDASQLTRVLSYVAEVNYFDFADLYGVNESDLPGTFTLVKTSIQKKVIYDYGNVGPARLVAFEDMIDHLLEGAKWKRD